MHVIYRLYRIDIWDRGDDCEGIQESLWDSNRIARYTPESPMLLAIGWLTSRGKETARLRPDPAFLLDCPNLKERIPESLLARIAAERVPAYRVSLLFSPLCLVVIETTSSDKYSRRFVRFYVVEEILLSLCWYGDYEIERNAPYMRQFTATRGHHARMVASSPTETA